MHVVATEAGLLKVRQEAVHAREVLLCAWSLDHGNLRSVHLKHELLDVAERVFGDHVPQAFPLVEFDVDFQNVYEILRREKCRTMRQQLKKN